ncbi:hypothetical protein [Hafnia alvei]|nr:hypothetical protein [Hafnia alvei]
MADIDRNCSFVVGITVVYNQFRYFELKFCCEKLCHWITCGVGE